MEEALKGIVATQGVPADLTVTYDDMHGLWGGTTVTVRGGGSVELRTRALGAPEAEVTRKGNVAKITSRCESSSSVFR